MVHADFTELRYANGQRKAFLIPIVGHVSKVVHGRAIGEHADTPVALQARERARAAFQKLDIAHAGMIMHHDRDAVFAGCAWTAQRLLEDEMRLSYALRGAKENPEMEAFNSRLNSAGRSLFLVAQSVTESAAIVAERLEYYNTQRRHSSIGYLAPLTYIERIGSSQV